MPVEFPTPPTPETITVATAFPPGTATFTGTPTSFTGSIPDYTPQFNNVSEAIENVAYELAKLNYTLAATSIPGEVGAILKVNAGAVNDMSSLMAEMLEQQIIMKGNIAQISNALATLGGTLADGVATQQILTVATIKKQEKDIAETEAALARQNPPIAPQVITPAALTSKITGTITDTGILAAQSKASGLASTAVSGALERGTNIVSNWFSGTAISDFFSKNVATIGAAKTAEPAPVAAATTVKSAATARDALL